MHIFAILVLFGLGVTAAAVFLHPFFARFLVRELWALIAVGAGIGLAWAANFDMWRSWNIPIRAGWIGITLTGLALGGIAYFFHEVLGFFSGLHRKYDDEAAVLEHDHAGIRRAA